MLRVLAQSVSSGGLIVEDKKLEDKIARLECAYRDLKTRLERIERAKAKREA